jgi:spermidine/putrescine transport system substrate-binding protein
LENFTAETGLPVRYVTYKSQEEAVKNLRSGQIYDVVILDNQHVPALVSEGLLAEIDYRRVPNFKNISPSFIDLSYDPQNRHTIPYTWGTVGLVVRDDLVEQPIRSWSDLWNKTYPGKLILSGDMQVNIGVALKSLGFSINSNDPVQLKQAGARLEALKQDVLFADNEEEVLGLLENGECALAIGYASTLRNHTGQVSLRYVIPEEGALLWGDNFSIPASSRHQEEATQLINYLLQAHVMGQIINQNHYATANEAAIPYIDEELRNDSTINPSPDILEKAEAILPLSSQSEGLYREAWERFIRSRR